MVRPGSDLPPRLQMKNISKTFPGVKANEDVNFTVGAGEVHALLGENGAGKSTVVKIIYGVQQSDPGGEIFWDGKKVSIPSPRAARQLGIGMVFQHFSVFDALTVLENIALGMDEAIDAEVLKGRVKTILDSYSLPLDPDRYVHTLSVGERQRIEIVRCLLQKPRLLIMDEPTSVLTPQEVDRLFDTLRQLAAEGCSILYISHKLHEIKAICDHATILRGGKVVGECDPKVETTKRMAELMIGAELKSIERKEGKVVGATRLLVSNLTIPGVGQFETDLEGIDMDIRAGEVLGIAGVAGNGQSELLLALSGETLAPEAGMIKLDNAPIGRDHAGTRRKAGLCTVPEERNGHAAVPDFSLSDNAILTARHRMPLAPRGFINIGGAFAFATDIIGRFFVKATGPKAFARSLSGGNLQKFIMGREMMQTPEVLIVAQPTWGVDAGAASQIRQALLDLAARGSAIVVISQDLDELLEISDRIAVINEGHLSKSYPIGEVTIDQIGMLMGGMQGDHAAPEAAPHLEAAHA